MRAPRVLWWLLAPVHAGAGCFSDSGVGLTRGESTSGESTGDEGTSESSGEAPTTCADECAPEPVCGDGVAMAPEQCDDGDDDDTDVCTSACKLPACGDGFVQGGEGCDDGPGNADDGTCTLACALAACGDGNVQAGVEACDDGNLVDGDGCSAECGVEACGNGVVEGSEKCDDGNLSEVDDCKTDCTRAKCGDLVVAVDATEPEECDDGNTDEADGCNSKCTLSGCGDGFVQPGEACDDGDLMGGSTCGPMCERLAYYVFVTSKPYAADFGGVAGADLRCNQRAQAAGLPGQYAAWISQSEPAMAAWNRLHHATEPYVLIGGEVVAIHWTDLSNGNLATAIDRDETGAEVAVDAGECVPAGAVWTGTEFGGNIDGDDCTSWTTVDVLDRAQVGMLFRQNGEWTDDCKLTCDVTARLYCVEQPIEG